MSGNELSSDGDKDGDGDEDEKVVVGREGVDVLLCVDPG